MRLEYQPQKAVYTLHVPPHEAEKIRVEHGFDHSLTASTENEAVLYTSEPLAAVAFYEHATPLAMAQLVPLRREIDTSWRLQPRRAHWDDWLKPDGCEPYGLQLANLEYAERRQHTLIGDEPGVGKTLTAILYGNMLARRSHRFRALAIVPASIRLQWYDRIWQWCTIGSRAEPPRIVCLSNSQRGVSDDAAGVNWTIMSYETARQPVIHRSLMKNSYDLLVLDEAHYLKSPAAARTRAIFGAADKGSSISDRCRHILALTGTPIPNRPREAFTLAKSLCHEAIDFQSERAFNERFNPRRKIETESGRVIGINERRGRFHELQARLRYYFMTRHLFADAFPQLRLPLYDLIYAEETTAVRAALEAERLLDIDPDRLDGIGGKIDGAVSTARLMMGLALAPQAARYIKMVHAGGDDKIVVFAWHREVMDFLQKELDPIGVVRVDGRTTEAQKARAVVAFQTNPAIGIILGNVLSLGTGTDGLQHVSRRAILAEPEWVSGNNEQCFRRLHRVGQKAQVLGDIIVARKSLAEHILGTSLRKGQVIHSSLDERI